MPSADPQAVIGALGLRAAVPASWRAGAGATAGVFVAPPLAGWTLVVGPALACEQAAAERVPRLLERLSEVFGAAAWFRVDDDREAYGWGVGRRGRVVRAYAWDCEHGEVMSVGETTDDEAALGCFVADPRDRSGDEVKWWPDRQLVLRLAERWSLSPSRFDEPGLPSSAGWLARL